MGDLYDNDIITALVCPKKERKLPELQDMLREIHLRAGKADKDKQIRLGRIILKHGQGKVISNCAEGIAIMLNELPVATIKEIYLLLDS